MGPPLSKVCGRSLGFYESLMSATCFREVKNPKTIVAFRKKPLPTNAGLRFTISVYKGFHQNALLLSSGGNLSFIRLEN